eukprot:3574697-Amphidinium_carterae.1
MEWPKGTDGLPTLGGPGVTAGTRGFMNRNPALAPLNTTSVHFPKTDDGSQVGQPPRSSHGSRDPRAGKTNAVGNQQLYIGRLPQASQADSSCPSSARQPPPLVQ